MNYNAAINYGSKVLKKNLVKTANIDSEIILSKTVNLSREKLLLNLDNILSSKQLKYFKKLINRRKKKEPIAYILKKKEFWKNSFTINSNVLIPRPDTEIMVEQIFKYFPSNCSKSILEIGTGSGCIILSILAERKNCYAKAIDISKKALKVAEYNAKIQHLGNRIEFIYSGIDKFYTGKYDIIISNPPYIKSTSIKNLDEDVRFYEPRIALDGGYDGCSQLREIIKRSSSLLKNGGKLFLEIGHKQIYEVKKLLKENHFYINKTAKDLNKINRCVISTKI
jgi:release factor glutamine methyltransferase|tara:strand:+ start:780 stop:1622 length:843 start_codon:yes stop_codon:yes gene_type:complete